MTKRESRFSFFLLLCRKYGRDIREVGKTMIEYAVSIGLCPCGERWTIDWESEMCYCPVCGEMLYLDDYLEREEALERFVREKLASNKHRELLWIEDAARQLKKRGRLKRLALPLIEREYGSEVAAMIGMWRMLEEQRRQWERELEWKERQDGVILSVYIYPRRTRVSRKQMRRTLRTLGLTYLSSTLYKYPEDSLVNWFLFRDPSTIEVLATLHYTWFRSKKTAKGEGVRHG